MKLSFKFLLLIVALCTIHSGVYAQIPRILSYQGVLTDPNGTLLPDGNHVLKLTLYSSAFGTTPLYFEIQSVPVIRGVFNVIIGTSTPIPTSLTFDRAYFLGVSVDGGPELQPRTPLTSVPYALHAGIADNLSDDAPVVKSLNGLTGNLTISAGNGINFTQTGSDIKITNSAAPGSGGNFGFVLPYAGSTSTPNAAFKVTNTNNGLDAYAIHGVLDNTSAGLQAAAVRGENRGTGSPASGSGVFGSHNGNGWGVLGTSVTGTGVHGTSTGGNGVTGISQDATGNFGTSINSFGVRGVSTNGVAGSFELSQLLNAKNALQGITIGNGYGAWGQGRLLGVKALAIDSLTTLGFGINAEARGKTATAVLGDATSWNTITYGVYGTSRSIDSGSVGVYGNQTSPVKPVWGVFGNVVSGDTNSAGVRGVSTNRGAGVMASYTGTSTTGTALEINNGYLKVTGATNRTAFIHTTSLININANQTRLNYNGMDATDILIITPNGATVPVGDYNVFWTGSEWRIYGASLTFMPVGISFNVLIIKQKS